MSPNDVQQAISGLLKQLFDIRRQRVSLKNDFEDAQAVLKQEFTAQDDPLAQSQAAIMAQLHQLLTQHKLGLLSGTLKSFAMIYGKVSYKSKRRTFKVTDKSAVEKLARGDGILTKVCGFTRAWKIDLKQFEDWLEKNPSKAAKYQAFIERDGGYDEIFASPNGTYLTQFDPNRLTEKSIKIEGPPGKDDSPDA